MKVRCIKSFIIPICDDDGLETGEDLYVEKDEEFTVSNRTFRLIDGEIRLESDNKWLEIPNERFKECFVECESDE